MNSTIRLNKNTKTIKVVNRKDTIRLQHSGKIGPEGPEGLNPLYVSPEPPPDTRRLWVDTDEESVNLLTTEDLAETPSKRFISDTDYQNFSGKAPLASPVFTGVPEVPVPAGGPYDSYDNTIPNTLWVQTFVDAVLTDNGINNGAPVKSSSDTVNLPNATPSHLYFTTDQNKIFREDGSGGFVEMAASTPYDPTTDTTHLKKTTDTFTGSLTVSTGNILIDNAKYIALQGTAVAWKVGRNIVTPTGNIAVGSNRMQLLVTSNSGEGLQVLGNSNVTMLEVGNSGGTIGQFNHGVLRSDGNVYPTTNTAVDLGTTALYWNNVYAAKYFLNSTASLSGATAGVLAVVGQTQVPVGSATTPSYSFTGWGGYGFYFDPSAGVVYSHSGTDQLAFKTKFTQLAFDGTFGWGSAGAKSGIDTGISRTGANAVAIGNGTQGNASGTLSIAALSATGTSVMGAITVGNQASINGGSIQINTSNYTTAARSSYFTMTGKNTADLGGVQWTWYADADNNVVGNMKYSLYGYPKKTLDGSNYGFEEFMNFSFPTYDGATTYTKRATINAPLFVSQLTASDIYSNANNTYGLGNSANYWNSVFAKRYYLSSTAYIDGATAGRFTVNNTGQFWLTKTSTNISAANPILIQRAASTDAQSLTFGAGVAYDYHIGRLASSDDLVFGIDGGSGFSEKIRFTTGGKIGIGRSPSFMLDIDVGTSTAEGIRTIGTVSGGRIAMAGPSGTSTISAGDGGASLYITGGGTGLTSLGATTYHLNSQYIAMISPNATSAVPISVPGYITYRGRFWNGTAGQDDEGKVRYIIDTSGSPTHTSHFSWRLQDETERMTLSNTGNLVVTGTLNVNSTANPGMTIGTGSTGYLKLGDATLKKTTSNFFSFMSDGVQGINNLVIGADSAHTTQPVYIKNAMGSATTDVITVVGRTAGQTGNLLQFLKNNDESTVLAKFDANGTLTQKGAVYSSRTVTTATTLTSSDYTVRFDSTSALSQPLPTAGVSLGQVFVLKNVNTGVVTITTNMDGANRTLNQYDSYTVQFNGTDYDII